MVTAEVGVKYLQRMADVSCWLKTFLSTLFWLRVSPSFTAVWLQVRLWQN